MAEVYLGARLEFLRRTQNADGGWGYFPAKGSWFEPTAYALLALHGDAQSAAAVRRGWELVRRWQRPDGSWKPAAQVEDSTWVTALGVTLCCVRGERGPALRAGVERLLSTMGAEYTLVGRAIGFLGFGNKDVDTNHPAWPWHDGTSSWIEPTAHSLVALKKTYALTRDPRIPPRIQQAEQMVLGRRCSDGGWNYGAPRTYGITLPSYPETTALAVLALQGCKAQVGDAAALCRKHWNGARRPLAAAWLAIAIQTWNETVAPPEETDPPPNDVLLTALQALAHPQGNHNLLRTEA